ncbi:MAG TPA: hypothetical protein V6C81_05455 [Planktothrix sp.]|jgi:hypothetical protein
MTVLKNFKQTFKRWLDTSHRAEVRERLEKLQRLKQESDALLQHSKGVQGSTQTTNDAPKRATDSDSKEAQAAGLPDIVRREAAFAELSGTTSSTTNLDAELLALKKQMGKGGPDDPARWDNLMGGGWNNRGPDGGSRVPKRPYPYNNPPAAAALPLPEPPATDDT